MKNGKYCAPMHLADGGIVPRPVSPFSLRGMYDAVSGAASSVASKFQKPAGYEPAVAAPSAAPVAPAPVARPQIGGVDLNTLQRREAAAGLRDGIGRVGDAQPHIVPGKRNGNKDTVPARLTPDEAVLPVDTVDALGGPQAVQNLIDATHTPVKDQGLRAYANGGLVEDPLDPRYPQGQQGPSVSTRVAPAPAPAPQSGGSGLRGFMDSVMSPTGGFMPATRAVMRGAGEDISQDVNNGAIDDALGKVARGAVALPIGIASDLIGATDVRNASAPASPAMRFKNPVESLRDFGNSFLGREGSPSTMVASTVTPGPGASAANPTDLRLRTGAQTTPLEPGPTSTVPGVTRVGNSFSNTGEQQGSAGVSVVPSDPTAMERTQRAAAIEGETNKMRMGLRDYGDASYYTTGPGAQGGAQAKILDIGVLGFRQEGDKPSPSLSTLDRQGLSMNQRASLDSAAARNTENNETARANNESNNRTSLRNADLQFDSARARDEVTMRGQNLDATSRAAKAQQDQANSDRQYKLEVQKFGVDVAEKNRVARSASDESVRKTLETRFRKKDDEGNDVADTAKVASFTTALSSTLPRMIEQLESTGKPEAVAKAKQLRERGAAALEPGDMDGLQRLFDTRERMRSAKGLGPNQGTFADSDNLMDFRQTGVEKRAVGGNRVVTPAGSVSVNDLRYSDGPANALLPDWFKTENKNLTRGLRLE
jgi:hypothetical protein